jgi:chromosome segregation ATPase
LQVANQQVQSLEANVLELASKFTHLEGVLKTEQEAHRDTDKAYKDAEKKGNALQKNVAALQQELDDAKKAAEDTRASLGGEASQLSDSLDKARAELRELALDRDSLSDKAKGLTEKKVHILKIIARVHSLSKVPIALTFANFG